MTVPDKTKLMDTAAIMREYGIGRTAAEKLMRHVPKVVIEDLRKVYVRRRDVERYLERRTVT